MKKRPKLFMVMLGCKPEGRLTEQHDVFFGIGTSLYDLLPQLNAFWPDAKLHLDAWREVTSVNGFRIKVIRKTNSTPANRLFFLNLGGYRKGEFDEFHYKLLTVADSLAGATRKAKQTAFYKHYGFTGAVSHIDDKYGIDVDDGYNVEDILPNDLKEEYSLEIDKSDCVEDTLHIGYLPLKNLIGK